MISSNDIYLPRPATVTHIRHIANNIILLGLALEDFDFTPGQFVQLSLPGIGEAPITIASSRPVDSTFELVVRKVGNVTSAIHNLKPGDHAGIRGPFGKGYPFQQVKNRNLIFIAGGIGLIPHRSFITRVLENRSQFGDLCLVYGAKEYSQRLFDSEISSWQSQGMQILQTLDIPHPLWHGDIGVVTALIPKIATSPAKAEIFICGPPVMYKFVIISLRELGVSNDHIYLNIERRMRCGVGKCGHCQVNHIYVCHKGPVFRWSDIMSLPEAIS